MSNFIPNKLVRITLSDPPWITKPIKTMLCKQNRQYQRHGFRLEDKASVDAFRQDFERAVLSAKENYCKKEDKKLADPNTSQKAYWTFITRIMDKCKVPKVPPLFINNKFVINCKEKAEELNTYFSHQCKHLVNNRVCSFFLLN